MLPPLFLCTPPPPSAFDDLSQAHGEYSKGGYGGSAQSQAKSAGSGPGKGTNTSAHCNDTHKVSGLFPVAQMDVLTIADGSTVKSAPEKSVYMHVWDWILMCT